MGKQIETIEPIESLLPVYANGVHVQSVASASDGYVCQAESNRYAAFIVNACNEYAPMRTLLETIITRLSSNAMSDDELAEAIRALGILPAWERGVSK